MARASTSARRYAEAAFAVASEHGAVDAWHDELSRAAAVASSPQLARILENPGIPFERRREALERSLGQTSDGVRNLCLLLLQRGKLEALPAIAADFHRLVNRRNGVTEGIVTSAAPLQPAEVATLEERLRGIAGGRVELSYQVDPALLGGVVVRLGDRLLDGSVRGKLERLRNQLVSSVR
jgi:F-type H+-transporting ATPase subunit delta